MTPEEAKLLMKQGESCFKAAGKIQNRRTNLTFGTKAGMTYKVSFGYGANQTETIRKTLEYDKIPCLSSIVEKVERELEAKFPICAALRYPNGSKGIKRHRDREVPAGSTIAGLSVGESRTLIVSAWGKNPTPLRLELTPGSLYVFHPPTNEKAFHCIEEEPERKGSRISFTFRTNWTPDE